MNPRLTFKPPDYWRALVLYGLNVATYKIALAHALAEFTEQKRDHVTRRELAETFFRLYEQRLRSGMPQLNLPHRRTVMERIVDLYRAGSIDRDSAIDAVGRDAFNDVIPSFHVLGGTPADIRFYEPDDSGGLILTDNVFEVLTGDNRSELISEIDSRWDLLEAAFQIKRDGSALGNDVRAIYLAKGHERRPITHLIPVLNGYQVGVCFYCGEMMMDDIHVDHVIPRQFLYHDEIWNLVLAHGFCNSQKSDALPGGEYIEKLIQRNEHFIASNHPIKHRLIRELGRTPSIRARYINSVYADARLAIRFTWEGLRGYQPATDPFYRSVVRRIVR